MIKHHKKVKLQKTGLYHHSPTLLGDTTFLICENIIINIRPTVDSLHKNQLTPTSGIGSLYFQKGVNWISLIHMARILTFKVSCYVLSCKILKEIPE